MKKTKVGYQKVQIELPKVLLHKIQQEVRDSNGQYISQSFDQFISNALIEYIHSEEWETTKRYMKEANDFKPRPRGSGKT